MNKRNRQSILMVALPLALAFFLLAPMNLPAAENYFHEGGSYRIEFPSMTCDVLVLSEPDDHGWMRVRALDSASKLSRILGENGLLNINNAVAAKEIR